MNLHELTKYRSGRTVFFNPATDLWHVKIAGKRISGLEWAEYDEATQEFGEYIKTRNKREGI